MSGGNLPYHLRPNKAVERLLFVELLDQFDKVLSFQQGYRYIGFGGPQMEDFRVIHERFPDLKMISLEEDKQVYKRQKFNKPHTNIKFIRKTSGVYIANYLTRSTKTIFWLDYADQNERPNQIKEFMDLLSLLPNNSIIKITLNANPDNYDITRNSIDDKDQNDEDYKFANRLINLRADFERFLSAQSYGNIYITTNDSFPKTLLEIIKNASADELNGTDRKFQVLSAFHYKDGQRMLTVTGILGAEDKIREIMNMTKFKNWHFGNIDWAPPIEIKVPELTIKERIFINQLLPEYVNKPAKIQKQLKFLFDNDNAGSKKILDQYVKFYRFYPQFGRIAL